MAVKTTQCINSLVGHLSISPFSRLVSSNRSTTHFWAIEISVIESEAYYNYLGSTKTWVVSKVSKASWSVWRAITRREGLLRMERTISCTPRVVWQLMTPSCNVFERIAMAWQGDTWVISRSWPRIRPHNGDLRSVIIISKTETAKSR